MRQRLHLLVLCSMIEPTRTNRHIHFGRPPEKFLGTRHDVTTAQVFGLTINTQSLSQFFRTGIDARRQCCGTPLGFTSDSLFITYQRTSSPMIAVTALGCRRRMVFITASQSYSCFLPLGPSPFAPSNHTS